MVRLRRKQMEPEEFQMAPMIDMVFLLLVFFMTVSNLAQAQKQVELDLAESTQAKTPEDLSDRTILSVKADGGLYWGAASISPEDATARLQSLLAEEPDLRVLVRADRNTPYSDVKKVLEACAAAGAYEIIYATHEAP